MPSNYVGVTYYIVVQDFFLFSDTLATTTLWNIPESDHQSLLV